MPRIFDNIDNNLLSALQTTIETSTNADFCVGYFNLRGWKTLDSRIERWSGGDGHCCRLLVGMPILPEEELRAALSLVKKPEVPDNQTRLRLKNRLAEEFRNQIAMGAPTDDDERGLQRLAAQIRAKKVAVKLHVRHPLHAKLYLLFRPDIVSPMVGYLGSSNLTLSGLQKQGELNVDVVDNDACVKLSKWFDDRWNDALCIDISQELAQTIEQSWARVIPVPPYQIYINMAYHLSQEAIQGMSEFRIPPVFGDTLFDFQTAAVKIAAHHINRRDGVLIGDVVGLGKTLMATALAKVFEEDYGYETLAICPKNLVKMWEDYFARYRLVGKVISLSKVLRDLPNMRRYRLVVIDESHNLRTRGRKRYGVIQEYIAKNNSKCILLSATPYNKNFLDLSNQLRLFVSPDEDIGACPERLMRELGKVNFGKLQCPPRSISAFENSLYPDDWRDLMRLYMVRRTRSFIMNNYAESDPKTGQKFLRFSDGRISAFPVRVPKTIKVRYGLRKNMDQYSRLYSEEVVDLISSLRLPRYGLGNYIAPMPGSSPSQEEARVMQNLSRAGRRLMGFCRVNLFKRLESSGSSFIQSVKRHILRNYVVLYAIDNGLPIPIGTQEASLLDSDIYDQDADLTENDESHRDESVDLGVLRTKGDYERRAKAIYEGYAGRKESHFDWIHHDLFVAELSEHIRSDSDSLFRLLEQSGQWDPHKDAKLQALHKLVTGTHPGEKVLVFTQFADTVYYLESQLKNLGVKKLEGVTGDHEDPTGVAWRFSPESNEKKQLVEKGKEIRVLVATDVLSEGQNLQDCNIVVNYDLPWAIIRLIQRAGRVDRIGQRNSSIFCYSFLPAEGVERIIGLRVRVQRRLAENAEVVGADETFFEDEHANRKILDLYHEKAGILDGDDDEGEVDLASFAYQIWKNAVTADPALEKVVQQLPPAVFSTKSHVSTKKEPDGVLVYLRTAEGNDALAWIDGKGNSVTESQFTILKAAACKEQEPVAPRIRGHHDLVRKGAEFITKSEKSVGGQLGKTTGARYRTYARLEVYARDVKGTVYDSPKLREVIESIYRHPLKQSATDTLNRQLRAGASDMDLAQLVVALHEEGRLCTVIEEDRKEEPRIVCSLGLTSERRGT